jgi:hypothetical protein
MERVPRECFFAHRRCIAQTNRPAPAPIVNTQPVRHHGELHELLKRHAHSATHRSVQRSIQALTERFCVLALCSIRRFSEAGSR